MQNDIVSQNEEIISVGELNRSAKYLLENNFSNISVLGEISNLAKPSSGHIYFTLKDEDGAIRCAMFKNQNLKLNFSPENGDQCVLKGQVSLYAPRGDYQLIVKSIQPAGAGNLMQQFEALKKKLDQEGLFNLDEKFQIPESPKHIGIITSLSTAALQDIISTVERRAPSTQISVSDASVQGDNAHVSIIAAMERILEFNKKTESSPIDLVVFARGGGSIEDLWCFNNEELAREIYNYPIPTISGVGHEIDFTICDFVSDIRMPTPTAAAELFTEFNYQLQDKFTECKMKLESELNKKIDELKNSLLQNQSKLKNPITKLREISQRLDNADLRRYLTMVEKHETSTNDMVLGLSLADQIRIAFSDMQPTTICDRFPDIDLNSKRRYRCVAEYLLRQEELVKVRDREGKLVKKIGNAGKPVVLYRGLPKLLQTLKNSDLLKYVRHDRSKTETSTETTQSKSN